MYARFIPLLVERMTVKAQQKVYSRKKVVKAYTIYRAKGVPQQATGGDCGIYALKFIECLAIGCKFDGVEDSNMPFLRLKYAAEALDEVSTDTSFC